MLCDLGAEIIKIEPPDGDLTRFTNPRVNSLSTYFIQQNVGKKNISLDMSKPEAVDIVKKLVMHADILIENFRPGVMKKLGLDYASLSALNPKLIYASITGYGQTGPWVHRRAYAPVVGQSRVSPIIKAWRAVDNLLTTRFLTPMFTPQWKRVRQF
jgi:crotonobetainyl-CoA:carnitine CoA-transferase CaiB-like acyl-CoA transferase